MTAVDLSTAQWTRVIEACTDGAELGTLPGDDVIIAALQATQPPPPPPKVDKPELKITPDGHGVEVTAMPAGATQIKPAWSSEATPGEKDKTDYGATVPYTPGMVIPAKAERPYIGARALDSVGGTVGGWATRTGPTSPAVAPPVEPPKPPPSGLIVVAADIYQLSPNSEKGEKGIKAGPDVTGCVKAVRICGTSRGSGATAVVSNAEIEAWIKLGCKVIITDFNGGLQVSAIPTGTWAQRCVDRQKVNPAAIEEGNELYEAPWGPNQTSGAAMDAYIARLKAAREAMDKVYGRGNYAPLLACCQGSEKMFWTTGLVSRGLAQYVDGAVVHCYKKESQNATTGKNLSFERVEEVHQATGLPIWVTEFGAECPGAFSPEQQAAAIKGFVEKCKATPYVAGISCYAYEERGENFGLVDNNWHHKPAYAALHSVA